MLFSTFLFDTGGCFCVRYSHILHYSLSGLMLPITSHSLVDKGHLVVLVCRDVYFKHHYSWALHWYVL